MKPYLFSIFCSTIITLSLLLPVTSSANALSGSWTKDFRVSAGRSTYTLLLSSPDEVPSGSNLTITVSLLIDHMDTFKTFVFFSSIFITVETTNGRTLTEKIQFGHYPVSEFPERLYPGSRWGPNNVTFNLAEEDLDLPLGGSVDANIYVTVNIAEFIYQPFRAEQLPYNTYETFSLNAGTIKIINEGDILKTYLPYIIGLVVSVTILAGFLVRERLTNRQTR